MFNQIVLIVILLGVLGCGTMFDSGNDSIEEDKPKSVKIPEKIAFEIPKSLQNQNDDNLNSEENDISYAYLEVKDNINTFNLKKLEIENNLRLLNQIINDVFKICSDSKIEKVCTIQANRLFYIHRDTNKKTPFGKIEFVKYSHNEKYQYLLKVEKKDNTTQLIKWSHNEKYILSELVIHENYDKNIYKIDYVKVKNYEEKMNIYSEKIGDFIVLNSGFVPRLYLNDFDSEGKFIDKLETRLNLDITKNTKIEGEYTIKSNSKTVISTYDNNKYTFTYLSNGELSKSGGVLDIVENGYLLHFEEGMLISLGETFHNEWITFDAEGKLTSIITD